MNKLEQLKKVTTVVADTGDIEAIKLFHPQDATTNPSLVYKAAQLPQYAALVSESLSWAQQQPGDTISNALDMLSVKLGIEILKEIPGYVSTEVDARLSFDTQGTINKAKQLIGLYEAAGISRKRILIKIASTWEGIVAAKQLEQEGILCNLTLLFSITQAIACAQANVTLISPFVGRILDWYKKSEGKDNYPSHLDPGVISVSNIYRYFKTYQYKTIIMGASFRNIEEIEALAGCDKLTVSPQLLESLKEDNTPLTRMLEPNQSTSEPKLPQLSEAEFRWLLNEDPMATEKLAEGIRLFTVDIIKLETLLKQQLL